MSVCWEWRDGFTHFKKALVWSQMQTASSRIWTQIAKSISSASNHSISNASSTMSLHALYKVVSMQTQTPSAVKWYHLYLCLWPSNRTELFILYLYLTSCFRFHFYVHIHNSLKYHHYQGFQSFPISHIFWSVLLMTSSACTELMNVTFCCY